MRARALNLWVFRDSRRVIDGNEARSGMLDQIRNLPEKSPEELTAALLRAGELECGIADFGRVCVEPWMTLTDQLADTLISPNVFLDVRACLRVVDNAQVPHKVEVSPPEGFAYYALQPLAYADVLGEIPSLRDSVAVVGIRSIGSTLSAVTAAAARAGGRKAERITVRPHGHPYNRGTAFSPRQLEFVRRHIAIGSSFLVVDEGPGLSGSSFLSVAEALENARVPREQILLLCSHSPDFDELRADRARDRALRFRWIAVRAERQLPPKLGDFIGGGEWRKHLFKDTKQWPSSWISLERLKYRFTPAKDRQALAKFVGFGHYGEEVLAREQRVAEAEFAPCAAREHNGFASYPWIAGRPMTADDLSKEVIKRLAAYCAFRAHTFATSQADLDSLQGMAQHNLAQQEMALPCRLRLEHPVIVDGRMQPYEWLLAYDGQLSKTDSGAHGDDHFFPGPTDIAWDLAGAIVEWKMTREQAQYFLECYDAASGDNACTRVADFVVAYSVFRSAYCRMAANALAGSEEQARLDLAARRYKALLLRLSAASVTCA